MTSPCLSAKGHEGRSSQDDSKQMKNILTTAIDYFVPGVLRYLGTKATETLD